MANVSLRLAPPYTSQRVDLRNFMGKPTDTDEETDDLVLFPPGSPFAPLSLRGEGRTVVKDVPEALALALRTDPILRFVEVGSEEDKAAEAQEVMRRPARVPATEAHVMSLPLGVLNPASTPVPGGVELAPQATRTKTEVREETRQETRALKDAEGGSGS